MALGDPFWRAPALGEARALALEPGTVRYFDIGSGGGDPIVLIHGVLVNANLWRDVAERLALAGHRVIVPDLPLGAHEIPMGRRAKLRPTDLAALIADILARLDLDGVTLVGNDTGGALCQIVATRRPERIGRLVLTSCDAFENFLPAMFKPLTMLGYAPPLMLPTLTPLRIRALRRLPFAFGWLHHGKLDPRVSDSYTGPVLSSRGVRRDLGKVFRGIDPSYTLEAAAALARFDRPTLLAWSGDDRFFPLEHAVRLASILPNARVEIIEGARTFSAEDQPERLAALIGGFARS